MQCSFPAHEEARLAPIPSPNHLDASPESQLDGLVELVRTVLDVPLAGLSLPQADRFGFGSDSARPTSFCTQAIRELEPFAVEDASDGTGIRAYLGVPVFAEGEAAGVLYGADLSPRPFPPAARTALRLLGRQASALLAAHLRAEEYAANERRFIAFLDHSPATAFLKDEEGRWRFISHSWLAQMGYEASQVIGHRNDEWMDAETAAMALALDERARQAEGPIVTDAETPCADGTRKTWHTVKFPIPVGGRTWIGGIALDVTELREAESKVGHQAEELALRNRQIEERDAELTAALQTAEAAEESARVAAIRFEQLFDGLPVACFTYDVNGTIFEWNRAAEALWGFRHEEAFQASIYDVVVSPDQRESKREIVRRVFAGESIVGAERRETMRDGRVRWLLTNTFPMRNFAGEVVGAVSANVDVTERKQAEEALREKEERFRTVVESLQEGLMVMDAEGRVVYWNRGAERILGVRSDELNGRTEFLPDFRIVREDGSECTQAQTPIARALAEGEGQPLEVLGVERPDGERRWIEINAAPLFAGPNRTPRGAVASFLDVTERRAQQGLLSEQMARIQDYSHDLEAMNRRLETLATTDGLTGLKNHREFQDFLGRCLDQGREDGRFPSLVLLDVDHFKSYNDEFGHQAGDDVLRGVARTLSAVLRPTDLLARYGGEEFVIVLPGASSTQAAHVAERARVALAQAPFAHRDVTASFGVATADADLSSGERLIRAADEALYRSKARGRNRVTLWEEIPSQAA